MIEALKYFNADLVNASDRISRGCEVSSKLWEVQLSSHNRQTRPDILFVFLLTDRPLADCHAKPIRQAWAGVKDHRVAFVGFSGAEFVMSQQASGGG